MPWGWWDVCDSWEGEKKSEGEENVQGLFVCGGACEREMRGRKEWEDKDSSWKKYVNYDLIEVFQFF